jgi:hypothetical protein
LATRRPRRIDGRVLQAIGELRSKGWTNAAEIQRELERRAEETPPAFPVAVLPNLRTIQRILRDLTPRDDTRWSFADANEEDAGLVLPVLAAMIEESEGRRRWLTQSEARWILKIRRVDLAEPGNRLSHDITYELAFDAASIGPEPPYTVDPELKRSEDGQITYIEQYLAFGPWRSVEHETRYYRAFEQGWLGSRFMAYPRIYFTNDAWPKPLPAGYVVRERDAIAKQYAVKEGKARGTKRTR